MGTMSDTTSTIGLYSPFDLLIVFGFLLFAFALYGLAIAIYNIYFHPLSHIPGPKISAASRLRYSLDLINGRMNDSITKWHHQYGEVVRVAPNEVSMITGDTAWQDIYGFRTGKNKTAPYLKDPIWYTPGLEGVRSVLSNGEADHARVRKNLSHAFSDKALRAQEPLIQQYVDLFINRLHEQMQEKNCGQVDIVSWYNFTTFDIIADLTFGEPFYCLRDSDYHPWVRAIFQNVKAVNTYRAMDHFPFLKYFVQKGASVQTRVEFLNFLKEKVTKRLSSEHVRPDFMTYATKYQDEKGLSDAELLQNAGLFLIAGSETTATMLSGTTYCLLRDPDKMRLLTEEIRDTFGSMEEITIESVSKLPYLNAVVNEGLRMYPPVPTGFPRKVPAGGDTVSGYYLPGDTSVYVSQFANNHSERNFIEPNTFAPERWLDDSPFAADKKASFQPFSFGPRNCLGKNLAYAEMRLIISKMIWNFDLELGPHSQDWFNQRVLGLWEKDPLKVQLKPVART